MILYDYTLTVYDTPSESDAEIITKMLNIRWTNFFKHTSPSEWISAKSTEDYELRGRARSIAEISALMPHLQFVLTRTSKNPDVLPERTTYENGAWYTGEPRMRPYIVLINKTFIRNSELYRTADLTDDDMKNYQLLYEDSRWKEIEPTPFVGIVFARNGHEATQLAEERYGYDRRILLARPVPEKTNP